MHQLNLGWLEAFCTGNGAGLGTGFPKICGAMDGGAEAPQGCAARSVFWKGPPKRFRPQVSGNCQWTDYTNKNATNRERWWRFQTPRANDQLQATSAICNLIFFIAFFSSWRIRSADTPYLSASSCNVDLLSVSQRSRRISWLRSSRFSIACINRPLESSDQSAFSSCTAGSLRRSSR